MKDEQFITELLKQGVHYVIMRYLQRLINHLRAIRSLERDKQGEAERMQALKLVRKIMEMNASLLPYNLVHSLVSIAEHPEDTFCRYPRQLFRY
jgi:hypothetical protein